MKNKIISDKLLQKKKEKKKKKRFYVIEQENILECFSFYIKIANLSEAIFHVLRSQHLERLQ